MKFCDDKDKAILAFVEKLTKSPAKMAKSDVEGLKKLGLTDRGILEVVLVTSYFNFINRVADATGIELESVMKVEE
ncbi:MAG: peroxidase [Planctomycetes bacterium]|nr:peroxidase [Planctomycetota bacterium]